MGKKILLDVSPTGVQHSIEINDDELITVEHTPSRIEHEILDSCAQLRSLHQNVGCAFRLAARTPINTYMAWKKEWRENYADKFTWSTFEVMKLNSRDNENLRTGYKRGGSMKL